MRDVAALAKVSLKTVSRVVNGEPGVSPVLARRVMAARDRLGYRHDLTASSLRRSDGRSGTIGVVLEDVANPFASTLHRAIEDVAVKRRVLVLAGSSDEDEEREQQLVSAFASRRVDGLIIQPSSHDHSYLLAERNAGTPVVFVDRPPSFLDADAVVTDNVAGIRQAVRHLLDHGHRRIAYLGDMHSIATAAERHQGYVEELVEHNIAVDQHLVRLDLRGIEKAQAAAGEILQGSRPPTAVIAGQNLITIGAFRALRELGLHKRVALVGFDDFLLADLLEPAITVVAQDPAAIGRTAAGVLFRRLDGDRSPSQVHTVKSRMIARGSGEIPP
ncbi:MAG: LacI family transcriptional regulator [Actinobacteria bacterium 13_2_20CM_2_66_6]|nr:MAG: LacI family transcriptional regulator [Actinobacteria bacterium 13_2_20CM_2_66_6]